MSSLFNKYVVVCGLLLLLVVSCTKEGLIGPEGEQGPAGPNGVNNGGGGGSGAGIRVLTYYTPPSATLAWEATTGGNYRLKYTVATRSGYNFTLPDSVTKYINEGALLIYADRGEEGSHNWQQLMVVPAEFYAIAEYTYTIERIAGTGYRFSFVTLGIPHQNYTQLKFVVVPKTDSGVFSQ
jgi:hypothetical protein